MHSVLYTTSRVHGVSRPLKQWHADPCCGVYTGIESYRARVLCHQPYQTECGVRYFMSQCVVSSEYPFSCVPHIFFRLPMRKLEIFWLFLFLLQPAFSRWVKHCYFVEWVKPIAFCSVGTRNFQIMFLFHQGLGSGHRQYQPFGRRTPGPSCPIFSLYRDSSLGEREKATFPQPQGLDSSRTEQIWDLTPKKGETRLLWGLGGPDEVPRAYCQGSPDTEMSFCRRSIYVYVLI